MKCKYRYVPLFTPLLIVILASSSLSIEGRLLRYPDIHGNKIVFTYENDLWLFENGTGTARRLTNHPGWEGRAKFSPDGERIAFTGNYDGGWDVYIIPAEGGEPERMTYHPNPDFLIDWSVDGKYLLFRSSREDVTGRYQHLYRVSVEGGYPERMPVDMVRYASQSPDGKRLAYNRFNSDAMNWKDYKGGRQQDIWVTDLSGVHFEKITGWKGYDNYPMWHEKGIYFTSDREDGRMNLYLYNLAERQAVRQTFHTMWDMRHPSIGGDEIIYSCGGYLWIFDTITGTNSKVEVEIPSDRWKLRSNFIDPTGYIEGVALSADGDTAAVSARGDIYLLDREEEKAINLTRTPGSREINPAYSPDGNWIAFFSDRSGEYELYITRPERGSNWEQITSGSSTYYYEAVWSPDSKMLLYGDKDYTIYYIDIEKKKPHLIDRSWYQKDNEIFWKYRDYTWSPDSKWIAYSLVEENLNSSLFLYSLSTGKSVRLTDFTFDDFSPAFDPSGKHLFFLSLRNFEPLLDPFMDNNVIVNTTGIYLFQLQANQEPPFEDTWNSEDGNEEEDREGIPPIEPENIGERLFAVPVPMGTYRLLTAGDKKLYYLSRKDYGFPSLEEFVSPRSIMDYDLYSYDLTEEETENVLGGVGHYSLSNDMSVIAYRSGETYGTTSADGGGDEDDGTIFLGPLKQRVDVLDEYRQMFLEAWRLLRDFFYDPDMHGKDWTALKEKYEELLPYVGSKGDLDYILGEMTGELTASHEYIFGSPTSYEFDYVSVGLLGADLLPDPGPDAYRFTHILPGDGWNEENRNPLRRPDLEVAEGYYLFSIDGHKIHAGDNYLRYLVDKGGQEVTISIGEDPDPSKAKEYTVETLTSDRQLRYHEWVASNRSMVEEATGGRVCYMHLLDMDEVGIEQFERDFRAYRYCDGLIIDVRENGGGFVSWFLIDKLERKLAYFTRTRDFKAMRYPHGVQSGPRVLICNSGTGSDGEIFTQHFKDLELGTVIGTPTWGGLIGIINMIPLVDGTLITQPNVGFYDAGGEWIVENRGVQPDIYLANDPASVLAGRDPQLEKAIELVLKELDDHPPVLPESPSYPKK